MMLLHRWSFTEVVRRIPYLVLPFLLLLPGGAKSQEDPIRILTVSIENDAQPGEVSIVFRVDLDFVRDSGLDQWVVLINRYDDLGDGSFEEIAAISVDDLPGIPGQEGDYLFLDQVPEGFDPPFRYYLALAYGAEQSAAQWTHVHGSILLHPPVKDPCRQRLLISWENYEFGSKPGQDQLPTPFFEHNRILLNGEVIGAIPHLENTFEYDARPGTHNLRIQSVVNSDADNPGLSAYSNAQAMVVDWPVLESLGIVGVDVTGDAEVKVDARIEGDSGDFVLYVERSDDPDEGFEQLGQLGSDLFFTDNGVPAGLGMWYYRLQAYVAGSDGVCDEPAMASLPESTIFLRVDSEEASEQSWEVWLDFGHETHRQFNYDIEMRRPGDPGFETVVKDVWPGLHPLDLSYLLPFSGDIVFRVRAAGNQLSLRSNEVVAGLEPVVHIPNAFRPERDHEENRRFYAEFIGFEPLNYQMSIYDRHGLMLFSSSDPHPLSGWDGLVNGQPGPAATYMYLIRYTDPSGNVHEQRGVVFLVR